MVTVEAQLVRNDALRLSARSSPHKDLTGAGR
jgi:hypothetical protein